MNFPALLKSHVFKLNSEISSFTFSVGTWGPNGKKSSLQVSLLVANILRLLFVFHTIMTGHVDKSQMSVFMQEPYITYTLLTSQDPCH